MLRKLIPIVSLAAAAVTLCPAGHVPLLQVTAVRCWALSDVTRVAIQTTGDFQFHAETLQNPNRVFFDIYRSEPSFRGERAYTREVNGRLIKRIRVAETLPGVTRIVFDLVAPVEFTASQLANPERLMVEFRPAASPAAGPPVVSTANPQAAPATNEVVPPPVPAVQHPPERTELSKPGINPTALAPTPASATASRVSAAAPVRSASTRPVSATHETESVPKAAPASVSETAVPGPGKAAKDGSNSLIRALGLKVTRIVIDPGHGGQDEGTVGPHGLKEKDLVLDVAKRLGKLIEQRMGAEVIYTRTDDTFVPLEQRTELANEKKADLFLSLHANFSQHSNIAGVETFYLNFTESKDALDVAARENASSQKSIYELRDIIQKITLHDKAEESKEFATRIQTSLQAFERRYMPHAKDRGVKKAPFVVLIGARMPSVLAEVGFLSNRHEESLLRRPAHRQRLAEALYRGVYRYAQSLSHFQVADNKP